MFLATREGKSARGQPPNRLMRIIDRAIPRKFSTDVTYTTSLRGKELELTQVGIWDGASFCVSRNRGCVVEVHETSSVGSCFVCPVCGSATTLSLGHRALCVSCTCPRAAGFCFTFCEQNRVQREACNSTRVQAWHEEPKTEVVRSKKLRRRGGFHG